MPVFDLKTFAKLLAVVAALGVAIAAVVATPLGDKLGDIISSIGSVIATLLSYITPYLIFGRKALNLLVLPGMEWAVDVLLWTLIIGPLAYRLIFYTLKIVHKFMAG